MAPVNQRDCFATFGPCHRRQIASIDSSISYRSDSSTSASTKSSESSRWTSISDIDSAVFARSRPQTLSTKRITLASYAISTTQSGPSRVLNGPYGSQHRHIRNLSLPSLEDSTPLSELDNLSRSPEMHNLRDLLSQTKKLLSSCCLYDSRMVVVSTNDGITAHLQPDVLSRKTFSATTNSWSLQSLTHTKCTSRALFLLLQRPVTALVTGQRTLSLVARIDITGLLAPHGFDERVDDVWLDIAADALRALAPHKPHLLQHIPDPTHFLDTHPSVDLRRPIERIGKLYDAFLIIEPTVESGEAGYYEVTHVAGNPDVDVQKRLKSIAQALQAGEYKLARLFALGHRFIFDARRDAAAAHEFVWCVPMSGHGMLCWVGFLMSSLA